LEPAGGRCGPDGADGVVGVTVAAAAIHDKQFFLVNAPASSRGGFFLTTKPQKSTSDKTSVKDVVVRKKKTTEGRNCSAMTGVSHREGMLL
jgi:hypothetical protein